MIFLFLPARSLTKYQYFVYFHTEKHPKVDFEERGKTQWDFQERITEISRVIYEVLRSEVLAGVLLMKRTKIHFLVCINTLFYEDYENRFEVQYA